MQKRIIDTKIELWYIVYERTVVLILTISKQITYIIGEENANWRTTQTKTRYRRAQKKPMQIQTIMKNLRSRATHQYLHQSSVQAQDWLSLPQREKEKNDNCNRNCRNTVFLYLTERFIALTELLKHRRRWVCGAYIIDKTLKYAKFHDLSQQPTLCLCLFQQRNNIFGYNLKALGV